MGERIRVVGVGPGHIDYCLPVARQAVAEAELLAGHRKMLAMFPNFAGERLELAGADVAGFLEQVERQHQAGKRVVVLVSGDPGIFSLMNALRQRFGPDRLLVIPGISSVQLLFARMCLPWDDTRILSLHARWQDDLAAEVGAHAKTAILTDTKHNPAIIARFLLDAGVADRAVVIGRNLSYPDETVVYRRLSTVQPDDGVGNSVMVVYHD